MKKIKLYLSLGVIFLLTVSFSFFYSIDLSAATSAVSRAFNLAGASRVLVNTGAGFGAVNTKIRIYANIITNTGSDITYATTANAGASFTINSTGYYCMSASDYNGAGGGMVVGLSLNSTHLTDNAESGSLTGTRELLNLDGSSAFTPAGVAFCGPFTAGDVIRPHFGGTIAAPSTDTVSHFEISRVR